MSDNPLDGLGGIFKEALSPMNQELYRQQVTNLAALLLDISYRNRKPLKKTIEDYKKMLKYLTQKSD